MSGAADLLTRAIALLLFTISPSAFFVPKPPAGRSALFAMTTESQPR
jgi:hypothetical protein